MQPFLAGRCDICFWGGGDTDPPPPKPPTRFERVPANRSTDAQRQANAAMNAAEGNTDLAGGYVVSETPVPGASYTQLVAPTTRVPKPSGSLSGNSTGNSIRDARLGRNRG